MLRSSATSYYEADGLGSATSLTNGAGALAQTYTFDSFGKQTASSGSLVNPFQYTGRESDSETSLIFYRARYYDSATGRFLSEDPARFIGSEVNFYGYVLNNPELLIDPLGLCPAGTHAARPDEILKILTAANGIIDQHLSYKDIKCNQFVDRSINNAFPGALPREFSTSDIAQGQGPFEKTDAPGVGEIALFTTPGHVVLISQLRNGKVSQFVGSQTSTGPASVNIPDHYWKGRLDADGNVQYYIICLPN